MTTKYITENQWTSHLNLSPTVEETVFILSKYHFMERSWNARNPPTFPTRAEPREGLPLGLASSFWCPREQQGVLGPGRDMSCSAYTILQQTSSCTLGKITILNSDFSRGSSSKLRFTRLLRSFSSFWLLPAGQLGFLRYTPHGALHWEACHP